MWRILVLTLSVLASANTYSSNIFQRPHSAATDAQIQFAIEKQYDDTGPGAKGQENAYKTYRTLEDALINYLDDPDTKLPDHEREKALNVLQGSAQYNGRDTFPKTENYDAYIKRPIPPVVKLNLPNEQQQTFYREPITDDEFLDHRGLEINDVPTSYQKQRDHDAFSFQKLQVVKNSPLNLAHYTKATNINEHHDEFDPNPQYTFSYGVHDKHTGDSKTAHETRSGDLVRGYYSFIDADGRQRTVHYTADDVQGFKATIQRTRTNAQ